MTDGVELGALADELARRVLLHRRPELDDPHRRFSRVVWSDQPTRPGDLHVNLYGKRRSSAAVRTAVAAGAVAALWRHPVDSVGAPVFDVMSERVAMSASAALLHGHPARSLDLVGVTGTNGKSTTVAAIGWGLHSAGRPSGLVSSLGHRIGDRRLPPGLTTPDAPEMQELLAQMVASRVEVAVVEASSQGLADDRLSDVPVRVGVCTTLGVDHLDVHGTTEAYLRAKRLLFRRMADHGVAVFNADEAGSRSVVTGTGARLIGVGAGAEADVRIDGPRLVFGRRLADLSGRGPAVMAFRPALPGLHARMNLAQAAVVLRLLGVDDDVIARAVETFPGIPRRLQVVHDGSFCVIDDMLNPHSMERTVAPTIGPYAQRARRHLTCLAVRGNRGVELNREQAKLFGSVMHQLGVDEIHVCRSIDIVGPADLVSGDELAAVVDELRAGGHRPVVHDELGELMAFIAGEVGRGDLVTLFGSQGMDRGAELLRAQLARLGPTQRWAARNFGPLLCDAAWRTF